jgi:hypothetical protein
MPEKPVIDLGRAQRISAVCAAACGVVAIALPVGLTGLWAFASAKYLMASHLVSVPVHGPILAELQPWQRMVGAGVSLVPALLISYGLVRAKRGLAAFARGDFFASDLVAGLRGYAAATFWAVLASLVATPILSVAVTWTNPPGQRELSLGVSSSDGFTLLGCGITWVLAAAMARASALARENAQFV